MADKKIQFNNDIVIIGQQPWDTEIGSNCKNIALEYSKTNRVLYINSPLDRITHVKSNDDPKTQKRLNIIRKKEDGLIKIKDNLWTYYPDCMVESINWINNDFIFNLINKINNYRLSKSIKRAFGRLNIKSFVLFNDSEIYKGFFLKEFLKPKLSVYYSRDYIIAVEYWKKHGEKFEPLLIKKADLCFSNSAYLEDYCRKYNSNAFDVGQGCDFDLFENVSDELPDDVKSIKGPRIGYVGALNSQRLSIDIIADIALALPDHNIVLIGPEDDNFKASKLHQISNVIFLGQKPLEMLAQYINSFDVCINPQVINELTIGNYPRKIDEYLALGKPVVASNTKAMSIFKDYVYLADDSKAYIMHIKKALNENNEAVINERKKFAFQHTWENSVKLMSDKIILELNKTRAN
ncbi:glycosyltransferase [Mucilaginibacter aquaedulcis]|uniref:glycosyltransferase n=1 Tax=Mucilaginibacter aquaedulcis TaxID=1187081 RepID=UPI0025B36248|nr:glycosyltransferase [Mucilaginibacter aquaedulcis]MDN3548271.1 glycosyltransferase [Mucilaginibacter aquaedulcis]